MKHYYIPIREEDDHTKHVPSIQFNESIKPGDVLICIEGETKKDRVSIRIPLEEVKNAYDALK